MMIDDMTYIYSTFIVSFSGGKPVWAMFVLVQLSAPCDQLDHELISIYLIDYNHMKTFDNVGNLAQTMFLQGVPQLSSHFVLVVFSASRARTEEYFTIFQQPRRRRFQNSPYFPHYLKNWSSYSTKRETNWILKV